MQKINRTKYNYRIYGSRGTIYECTTIAEARKCAGKTGRIAKINPAESIRYVNKEDLEDGEIPDDPWLMAKHAGINILSNMEFESGYIEDDKLVAVLFVYANSENYSFDIAVDPEYQRRSYGSELMDDAISNYREWKEVFPDIKFSLDAVSPIAVKMLKKRGFRVTKKVGERALMTRRK